MGIEVRRSDSLPAPRQTPPTTVTRGYAVKHQGPGYEAAVAHLVHDLSGGEAHDNPGRYLETLGITRMRDDERCRAGS